MSEKRDIVFSGGGRYVGEWKNGMREGYGTFFFADEYFGPPRSMKRILGGRYEGEWKNNKMEGKGTCYYPPLKGVGKSTCPRYEGEWKNNLREGNGTYYFEDGQSCKGKWKEDLMIEGSGTFCFSDGGRYEGEWKNGMAEGKGTYYYPRSNYRKGDNYHEGVWKDGKLKGTGTFYCDDGSHKEGTFESIIKEYRGGVGYYQTRFRDEVKDMIC